MDQLVPPQRQTYLNCIAMTMHLRRNSFWNKDRLLSLIKNIQWRRDENSIKLYVFKIISYGARQHDV